MPSTPLVIKYATSQNQPKPPKTSLNYPKSAKTIHNQPKTTQNEPNLVKTTQTSDGFMQLFICSNILENMWLSPFYNKAVSFYY